MGMLLEDVTRCRSSIGFFLGVVMVLVGCTSSEARSDRPEIKAEAVEEVAPADVEPPPESTTVAPQMEPDQQDLPTTAAEMVVAFDEAEAAVADSVASDDSVQAWGRRQQMLYQVLLEKQDWSAEVEADISDDARASFDLNWKAKKALTSLSKTKTLTDTMPAWRLGEPEPAKTLLGYYKEAETESGVAWQYLAAINLVETRMGRIDGVSTAGAEGPMQFLPTTWAECCEGDPAEPRDAILGAAKYLTDRGAPQDMDRAILGYNNSKFYVEAVKAYADALTNNEQLYYGYHSWEVYFRTVEGIIRMPADYNEAEPVPVKEWLKQNPDALFSVDS